MAGLRSGGTLKLGDDVVVAESVNTLRKGTKCKVCDFNELGYPILRIKSTKREVVVSALITWRVLDLDKNSKLAVLA